MANVDIRGAARRGAPVPRSPLARLIAGAAIIAALFTILQAVDYHLDAPSVDSYEYARQALRFLGDSPSTAATDATSMFCHDPSNANFVTAAVDVSKAPADVAARGAGAPYKVCVAVYPHGLSPLSPRYIAIFTSRPGYPLLATPFVAVAGLRLGLWLTALLCTLVGGAIVLLLLRSLKCPPTLCLVGEAIFFAAPTGYWGTRLLTDGPSLTASLLAALGALWLIQARSSQVGGPSPDPDPDPERLKRQMRLGTTALVVGLAADFVIRYSSETPLAAFLLIAAGFCLWRVPELRHRGTVAVAAICGGALVVSFALTTALGWPNFSESLQDTFTKHFLLPDVADPLRLLVRQDRSFWTGYPVSEPTALLLIVGGLVVAVALYRADRAIGVVMIALSATGILAAAAHPVANQADRLMSPAWMVIVIGLPLLLAGARRAPSAAPAPSDPRREEPVVYAADPALGSANHT